jgi:hypothetical protein
LPFRGGAAGYCEIGIGDFLLGGNLVDTDGFSFVRDDCYERWPGLVTVAGSKKWNDEVGTNIGGPRRGRGESILAGPRRR